MTFQTETVLSCSVPPSSRGFERLNTETELSCPNRPGACQDPADSPIDVSKAPTVGTIMFLHPTTPAPWNRP